MKRTPLLLAAIFFFVAAFRVPAQTNAQVSAPSELRSGYGEKIHISGIRNAGKINEHLYRGAQPKEQGLAELKKLGVTAVVDLRGENQGKTAWERKHVESLGMRFIHIPVSGWSPPADKQAGEFLSIFRDDPNQKIFVHCWLGDDRTGVFVAIYRMAIEKQPPAQALKEMYYFGFNGLWHPAMKSFVRGFPARLNSAPDLAAFRNP